MDLHKKEKKIKSQKLSLKKSIFLSKRPIVLLIYPSCLNQGRTDGSALMFLLGNLRLVNKLQVQLLAYFCKLYPPLT
jgi:hypothetical protein